MGRSRQAGPVRSAYTTDLSIHRVKGTGGSGIGRAAAVLFAREGAKVGIVYLEQTRNA